MEKECIHYPLEFCVLIPLQECPIVLTAIRCSSVETESHDLGPTVKDDGAQYWSLVFPQSSQLGLVPFTASQVSRLDPFESSCGSDMLRPVGQ